MKKVTSLIQVSFVLQVYFIVSYSCLVTPPAQPSLTPPAHNISSSHDNNASNVEPVQTLQYKTLLGQKDSNTTQSHPPQHVANNTDKIVENHSANISNATLLNLLIEQTELMKNELCKSNSEIVKGLDKLISNTNLVKKKLKQITSGSSISKDEIILDFTVSVNNMNLIRAELNKMNSLIENIKKANCKEVADVQKKFDEAKGSLNKLVEGIQNFLRKTNLDFNLLILT